MTSIHVANISMAAGEVSVRRPVYATRVTAAAMTATCMAARASMSAAPVTSAMA